MCKCGERVSEHVSVSVKLPLVSFLNVLVCARGIAQHIMCIFARTCVILICVCMCVCVQVHPVLRQTGRESEGSSQLTIILSLRNSAD